MLEPPRNELLYRRDDPSDPRLGELVEIGEGSEALLGNQLDTAQAAIIGWPDDRGIRRNKGRPGAALGPDAIRKALYRFTPGMDGRLSKFRIVDMGNLKVNDSIEYCHSKAAKIVARLCASKTTTVCLGGGNDYAFADGLGLWTAFGQSKRIGAINIDSHLDVRDSKNQVNSGTAYFDLMEVDPPVLDGKNFVEFGIQPHHNSKQHLDYVQEKGVKVVELREIQQKGALTLFSEILASLASRCEAIMVSLDIDSVRQGDAPGCSAPYPDGLTATDVETVMERAGRESKVKLISIYEVSPPFDRDGQTAALAASAIWNFLSGLSRRNR